MSVTRKIQVRRGTASQWSTSNPVLSSGEFGYDTTNKVLKIGDGATAWASLAEAGLSEADIQDLIDTSLEDYATTADVNTALDEKQDLLTDSDPRDLEASVLLGAGNLHHWFERQWNNAVNTTEPGKNKRVSICYAGDSLATRCAGWIGYFASREYGVEDYGGAIETLGVLNDFPTGYQVPVSITSGTSGDVTAVTNGFSIWMSGRYWDIGTSGFVRWNNNFAQPMSVIKIYYVAESGAGDFVIETSPDNSTWTQQGASVSAANATQIGAVATRTVTKQNLYVRVRVTSGRVKVIGPYLGGATSVAGFDGFGISQGGISPSQWCTTPSAIYTPIMTDLNPSLITFHFDDPVSEFETNWTALMAIARAGNSARSVMFLANAPRQADGDASMTAVMKFLRSKIVSDNIAVFDMFSALGPWARLSTIGWGGDGIHLDQRAYAYAANVAYSRMTISTFLSPVTNRVANNLVVTDEINFGKDLPSFWGVPGRYAGTLKANAGGGYGCDFRFEREFSFSSNTGTLLRLLTANENVFPTQEPACIYTPNYFQSTPTAAYTGKTTGITEYVTGNKRVIRDEALNTLIDVGPYVGSATFDLGSISAAGEATTTVTVTGVTTAKNMSIAVGFSAALTAGIVLAQAWVSGTNTVTLRFANITGSPVDPASITAYVTCFGQA